MNNFTINTNFQIDSFNNSIDNYNKVLDKENSDFEKVFNSINQKPLEANAQFFQGADTIDKSKVDFSETISDSTKSFSPSSFLVVLTFAILEDIVSILTLCAYIPVAAISKTSKPIYPPY